ncbi:MAG: hypothetical protein VYB65_13540 [Myxococcota bacterium]|nr:hypothetical protein [Myxococcota bacterium]
MIMLVNLRACWVIALAALVWPVQPVAIAAGSRVLDGEITVAKRKKRKRRRRRKPKTKTAVKPAAGTPQAEPEVKKPEPAPEPAKPADARPGVAALDLEVIEGVSAGVGKLLNQVMMQRLTNSERFSSILGMGDIREMIDLESQKQALGCEQESCLAELGGALGVPLLIVPSLGKLGGVYLLALKINDVENAKVSVRSSRELRDEAKLMSAMKSLVDEALMRHFEPQAWAAAQAAKEVVAAPSKSFMGKAVGLSLMGLGAAAAGVGHFALYAPASQRFDETRAEADLNALDEAIGQANIALTAGVGLALAGGMSWWLLD